MSEFRSWHGPTKHKVAQRSGEDRPTSIRTNIKGKVIGSVPEGRMDASPARFGLQPQTASSPFRGEVRHQARVVRPLVLYAGREVALELQQTAFQPVIGALMHPARPVRGGRSEFCLAAEPEAQLACLKISPSRSPNTTKSLMRSRNRRRSNTPLRRTSSSGALFGASSSPVTVRQGMNRSGRR